MPGRIVIPLYTEPFIPAVVAPIPAAQRRRAIGQEVIPAPPAIAFIPDEPLQQADEIYAEQADHQEAAPADYVIEETVSIPAGVTLSYSDFDNTIRSFSTKLKTKRKPMDFQSLDVSTKIHVTKQEFSVLVKTIFEHPEQLKAFVTDKKLSNKQSKAIFACVNKLNAMQCACCRKFNPNLMKTTPIETELEPLLEIAKNNVKTRVY